MAVRERRRGEVVDSGEDTSDDDYSPGSLVIDAKEDGGTCTYVRELYQCSPHALFS